MHWNERHSHARPSGYAYHAYGITSDALILIRPDGYIGLTGASTGPQPIIDYLRNVISR
jgi:hypothetical protein